VRRKPLLRETIAEIRRKLGETERAFTQPRR
jgi:hypothetical protein